MLSAPDKAVVPVQVTYDPTMWDSPAAELRDQLGGILTAHIDSLALPLELDIAVAAGGPGGDGVHLVIGDVVCRRPSRLLAPHSSLTDEVEKTFLANRARLVTGDLLDRVIAAAPWLSEQATALRLVDRVVAEGFSLEHACGHAERWGAQAADADRMEQWTAMLADPSVDAHIHPSQLPSMASLFAPEIPAAGPNKTTLMRQGMFYELGIRVGKLVAMPTLTKAGAPYRFRINRLTYPSVAGLPEGSWLVNETADRLALLAVAGRATINPGNSSMAASIQDEGAVEVCERYGMRSWDVADHFILALSSVIRFNAARFINQLQVEYELALLSRLYTDLVAAVEEFVPIERLTRILRELVAERVSIRNLPAILQTLVDVHVERSNPDEQTCLRLVRHRLKAQLMTPGSGRFTPLLISEEMCEWLRLGGADRVDAPDHRRVLDAIRDRVPAPAIEPTFLVADDVRAALHRLIRAELPHAQVVAFGELAQDISVHPVDRIDWPAGI